MRFRAIIGVIGVAILMGLCLGSRQLSFAQDETLPGYVTYILDDTLYLEIVGPHQLKPGDTGIITSKGRDAAYVRVTEVGPRYVYLKIISQTSGVVLAIGDSIVFQSRILNRSDHESPAEAKWHVLDNLILGGELEQNTTYQVSAPWENLPYEKERSTPTAPTRFVGPPLPTSNYLPPPTGPRISAMPAMPSVPPTPTVIPEAAPPVPATPPSVPAPSAAPAVPPPPPPVAPTPTTAVVTTPPVSGSTETAKSPMLNAGASGQNVVLVLKPLAISAASKSGNSQDANSYHGRIRNREVYQDTPDPATHTLESRLDFDGSIERLNGSPWSAVWSGNESYRDGNTGQSSTDYEHPELHIYNAMLARKNEDGGSLKLGRFLPSELPGLGFLDGGQLDHVFSPQWRAGGVLAARPDRITLGPTTKEPITAAYASTEQGTHGQLYYSGTLGMYHTFYRGVSDELALLVDHRADLGPKLNLFSSSQIDFNGGAQQVHKGPRIIRLDLFGNSPITPTVNLRAGLSHFERPDDAAERDLTAGTTQGFDNGFWRYSVGANERLPWNFSLDEDLSVINSATAPTDQLWRITMSRFGFFFLPRGQISISAYNVTSAQGQGFGFQASASTPLWGDKLSMNLSSSSQYSSPSNSQKNYDINDMSVRLNWRISKSWDADFGVTQSYAGGRATSTVGDSSVGYRW